MVLTKICMPPRRCLPSPGPNVVVDGVRNLWAQGWLALRVLGKLPRRGSCQVRGGCPDKGLARGSPHCPIFSLCFWSLRCLGRLVLWLLSGFPPFPCLVWPC